MVATDKSVGICRVNDEPAIGIRSLGPRRRSAVMPIRYLEPVKPARGRKACVVGGQHKGRLGTITREQGRSIVVKPLEGTVPFEDVIDNVVMLA